MVATPSPKTRLRILRLQHDNPSWTLVDLAQAVGCTKQNVSQLLQSAGLPKSQTRIRSQKRICPVCQGPKVYDAKTCMKCIERQPVVRFICEECQTVFERAGSDVKYRRKRGFAIRWCSQRCHGKYINHSRLKPVSLSLPSLP